MFAQTDDIEVVAAAHSGRDALVQAAELEPDLVLMDLCMPGIDGLEASRIMALLPRPPLVVIMTAHNDDAYRAAAFGSGAHAFLRKDDVGNRLLSLLRDLLPRSGDDGEPERP
jgi:CheY-like chemotaxis protein